MKMMMEVKETDTMFASEIYSYPDTHILHIFCHLFFLFLRNLLVPQDVFTREIEWKERRQEMNRKIDKRRALERDTHIMVCLLPFFPSPVPSESGL